MAVVIQLLQSKDANDPAEISPRRRNPEGGILVARAYIEKSIYSSNIQSMYICQKKYRFV